MTMQTKNERINVRFSDSDMKLLDKAAKKYKKETGKKPMVSRLILHAVKYYLEHYGTDL